MRFVPFVEPKIEPLTSLFQSQSTALYPFAGTRMGKVKKIQRLIFLLSVTYSRIAEVGSSVVIAKDFQLQTRTATEQPDRSSLMKIAPRCYHLPCFQL
jgi:hypothetical protein